jgi:hypothetical protein
MHNPQVTNTAKFSGYIPQNTVILNGIVMVSDMGVDWKTVT